MRFLSYLTTLLIAALLSACGGGGGSAGSNPNTPTVFTTAPAQLNMPIGAVQQYSVRGGVAPYSVSSSNIQIVTASVNGETLILNSVGQGTANITIRDHNAGSTSIAVTVGDPLKLSMTTVKSFVGDKIKVLITGGTPPYRASTLELGVLAEVNGSDLLLTLMAVSKIDVVVVDALNQQAIINVEVITGSPQFNLVPAALTVSENSTLPIALTVLGGFGPFTVQSSDPNLLKAAISGNTVTVTTGSNGERCVPANADVTITVVDSRGGFATSVVSIVDNPAGCGLKVSANPVTVIVGTSVKLILSGLSDTGTVSLTSSDPTKATASYSGGVITVTGLAPTGVAAAPAVPGVPAGCGAPPAPACTTDPIPAVVAHDDPVTITVVDSGPPTRNVSFKVTVLK